MMCAGLRALFSRAAHLPFYKHDERATRTARCEASGVVRGLEVRVVGRWVERCTLEGYVYTGQFTTYINGVRVNRRTLLQALGDPA
jgi:hypothetical protein